MAQQGTVRCPDRRHPDRPRLTGVSRKCCHTDTVYSLFNGSPDGESTSLGSTRFFDLFSAAPVAQEPQNKTITAGRTDR